MTLPTIRLLGGIEITPPVAGRALLSRPQRLALLGWLAGCAADGPRQRDEIIGLFWPESNEANARNSLRQALHGLRQVLGADSIISAGTALGFNADLLRCDVVVLDRALREYRDEDAIAAYRGHFLHGLIVPGANEVMDWLARAQDSRRRLTIDAANRLAARAEANGDAASCLRWARRAAELHTPEERPSSALMGLISRAEASLSASKAPVGFDRELARAIRQPDPVGAPSDRQATRIAIMPMLNLSGDVDTDAIAEGLAALVSSTVGQTRTDVSPIGQASLRQLQSSAMPTTSSAIQLGAGALLSGTLHHEADALRLLLELTAASGAVLWRSQLTLDLSNLSAVVEHVRSAIEILFPSGEGTQRTGPTLRREAVSRDVALSVLRGNHHLWRNRPDDLLRAKQHFEHAITLNPDHAPALSGLALTLLSLPLYGLLPNSAAFTCGIAMADRSLAADPTYATGYAIRAALAAAWEWDFASAERLMAEAHALDPVDPESWIVDLLYVRAPLGQREAALRAAERLVALDPVSPTALAYASLGTGYFDTSVGMRYAREALELEPSLPIAHWALCSVAATSGEHDESIVHADLLVELTHGMAGFQAFRDALRVRAGQRDAVLYTRAECHPHEPRSETERYYSAVVLAHLGETAEAISVLKREVAARSSLMLYLGVDPMLSVLSNNPEFIALKAAVGVNDHLKVRG